MKSWKLRSGWIALLAGLFLALGTGRFAPAFGQGEAVRWEKPVRLSDPNWMAWFPDVVADDAGNVIVVWAGGTRRGQTAFDALMLTRWQGSAWSTPVDVQAVPIVNNESYAVRNSITLDRYGDVLATFRVPIILYFSKAPMAQATSAQVWASPRRLSGSGVAYYNELEVDSEGRIHVVWSEIVTAPSCEGCADIFYRFSDDDGETWSSPVNLARSPGHDSLKPHLWIGKGGWLYVTWQESEGLFVGGGKPAGVRLARSPDRGRTWTGTGVDHGHCGHPSAGGDRGGWTGDAPPGLAGGRGTRRLFSTLPRSWGDLDLADPASRLPGPALDSDPV
jgi:hypothetical protein